MVPPPKKWEDEESEEESSDESVDARQPVVAARKKFDDEEDSDDVADNWEEEEDSEAEREKAKAAAAAKARADAEAAKNKKSKSQRIEEHREANRRRRAAEEDDDEDDSEDEADVRARNRKNELDADMKHAQDLLDSAGIHPRSRAAASGKPVVVEDKKNPGQTIDLSSIPLFTPSTKTDFDALSEALIPLLRQSSTRPHYALWIPGFVKSLCQDLPSGEIKKVGSQITALSNEKMKEEKAQEKTGKKSKAAKTKTTLAAGRDVGRGAADVTSYDEDGLDDGDFM